AVFTVFLWIAWQVGYSAFPFGGESLTLNEVPHHAVTNLRLQLLSSDIREKWLHPREVVVRGVMPVRIARRDEPKEFTNNTVEWIADRQSGRSAMRWMEASGKLRLATWSPSAASRIAYIYREKRWAPYHASARSSTIAP